MHILNPSHAGLFGAGKSPGFDAGPSPSPRPIGPVPPFRPIFPVDP